MPLYAGHGRYFFREIFFGGQEAVTNVSGGHKNNLQLKDTYLQVKDVHLQAGDLYL